MKTPFTQEQVDALNSYQNEGRFHPYTCCGTGIPECKRSASYRARREEGKSVEYTNENEGVLIATTDGWVCPCGKYTQDWAH